LARLDRLLATGLSATAPLWPAVERAYGWVQQAADLLANLEERDGAEVRARYTALLTEMATERGAAGRLAPAIDHFLKVTASYSPGLFHCYDVADLPRTNNDLEHLFGTARHHERRSTGRKHASPALVVRGAVRVVAVVAARHRPPFTPADLAPHDLVRWRQLRQELAHRHEARRAQFRFRRDPAAYLAALEDRLLKSGLPA
jgi:hypothetical protein